MASVYGDVQLCTLSFMSTVSVSEARATLPDLLDRVLAGEEVTVTRHGHAVAVIVRPDALRVRRADGILAAANRLQDVIERGGSIPLQTAATISVDRAEELLADIAASRSAR